VIVILSKRFSRREGPGRAARSVAFFATQQSRVWLASLSNPATTCHRTCHTPPQTNVLRRSGRV